MVISFTLIITAPLSFATNEQEFSMDEINSISNIVKTNSLNDRQGKIKVELDRSKNDKFKDFLLKKIAIKEEILEVNNSEEVNTKYNNKSKNYYCGDATWSKSLYATFGNKLVQFNVRSNACADRSRVYSGFVWSTWADIFTLGWGYYGESNDGKFEYINQQKTEFVASRQGVFKLCISNNWVCPQESRPRIELHSTREGYADYSY